MSNQQPSRRNILKTAAAGAVALAAGAPTLLNAMQNEKKSTVLGTGAHTYEVVPGWGHTLPEGKKYGNTHGICETADGRFFIHNTSPTGDCVVELDPEGKFIRSWGKEYGGGSHGMQLRTEGGEEFLYFATTGNKQVVKTNLKGEHVLDLGVPLEAKNAEGKPCYDPANPKYSPTNIAFHPSDGSFYVADGYGSNYVHHYDKDGKYLRTWGGSGNGDGQLNQPHGIWTDTRDPNNPRVVVADRANVRLQWFTLDGKYLAQVRDELRFPCHFDQRGTDLLIPDLQGRLTIFDKDNKLITHIGDNPDPSKRANNGVPPDQLVPGQFCSPHQAIWDRAGNLYCVEWLNYGRVTKLRHV
jgi:hypothetical protein